MKKLVLALIVVASLSACSKQQSVAPASNVSFDAQAKKDNPPLAISYDYKVERVKGTKNDYKVTLKIKELIINGEKFTDSKRFGIFAVVAAVNATKEKETITLIKPGEFTADNPNSSNLTYSRILVDNPTFHEEVGVVDNVLNSDIVLKIDGGNLDIKEYSNIKFENSSLTVNGGNLEFRDQSTVSFDVSGIKAEK